MLVYMENTVKTVIKSEVSQHHMTPAGEMCIQGLLTARTYSLLAKTWQVF